MAEVAPVVGRRQQVGQVRTVALFGASFHHAVFDELVHLFHRDYRDVTVRKKNTMWRHFMKNS